MKGEPAPAIRAPLGYTSVNEDWRTEADALAVRRGDAILCVTGSGARALDLLALDPGRVVAVDVNPAQTALLRLKVEALRALPFDSYARFLGLREAAPDERLAFLDSVLRVLPVEDALFWRSRRRAVAGGILWAGRWERTFRRVGSVSRLLRPRVTARLLASDGLDAQARLVRARWDTPLGRLLACLSLSRPVLRLLLRDPAFFPADSLPAGRYVHERMTAHLTRVLARESFLVGLVLTGRLPEADLPPHLTPEGAERIRRRLARLEAVTADVVELLGASPSPSRTPERFDAFSLSDVPSYLTQEAFERLLDGVVSRAAPGARFCVRLFLTRPTVPPRLAGRLVRDGALERRLAEDDHAFVYDFLAGRVAPA